MVYPGLKSSYQEKDLLQVLLNLRIKSKKTLKNTLLKDLLPVNVKAVVRKFYIFALIFFFFYIF